MNVKRTRWHPDTCGCVIDYEWDGDLAEDARVHTVVSHLPCPAHAEAEHEVVTEENQQKNQAVAAVLSAAPDLSPEAVAFAYDAKRHLRLRVQTGRSTLTRAVGRSLQAIVDARIGKGRATVIEE